jgi:hypothetical protein
MLAYAQKVHILPTDNLEELEAWPFEGKRGHLLGDGAALTVREAVLAAKPVPTSACGLFTSLLEMT